MPLENDGGEGSIGVHFEKLVFFNEIMTATTVKDVVFSGFSFYLLKDSGWYGVNEKYIEELQAGKNMGCGWYSGCKDNNNFEYFCD